MMELHCLKQENGYIFEKQGNSEGKTSPFKIMMELHCLKQEMAIFLKNKEIMNEIEKQGNNETQKSTGDIKFSVFPLLFPCS